MANKSAACLLIAICLEAGIFPTACRLITAFTWSIIKHACRWASQQTGSLMHSTSSGSCPRATLRRSAQESRIVQGCNGWIYIRVSRTYVWLNKSNRKPERSYSLSRISNSLYVISSYDRSFKVITVLTHIYLKTRVCPISHNEFQTVEWH